MGAYYTLEEAFKGACDEYRKIHPEDVQFFSIALWESKSIRSILDTKSEDFHRVPRKNFKTVPPQSATTLEVPAVQVEDDMKRLRNEFIKDVIHMKNLTVAEEAKKLGFLTDFEVEFIKGKIK
jgi:hypothetical protein